MGRELVKYTKDGKEITFKYDENGLRHRKTITENGELSEQYDYVWSDGSLISQTYTSYTDGVTTSDTARFIYDSWGTLQGFILNNSETYLYVKNLQGDIIAIVDELGEVIVEYSYDAWGNVTFHETSLQNMTQASTLCFVSPFTYRGYCYDYDIELYYLQSRYYSAEIGRFINADSADYLGITGTVLSFNLFSYCENNPVINVDYNGCLRVTFYNKYVYHSHPNDDDFFYNSNVKATDEDYKKWKLWGTLQTAASKLYPDGAAFYQYYRSNKGGFYFYDYYLAYKKDSSIRKTVDILLSMAKSVAKYFKQKNNSWYKIGSSLVFVECKTMNWKLALGGHRIYLNASVYYNSKTKKYTMYYTITAQDRYNFDGDGKNFYGIPDSANGRFVTLGWAKFFNSVGTMKGVLKW